MDVGANECAGLRLQAGRRGSERAAEGARPAVVPRPAERLRELDDWSASGCMGPGWPRSGRALRTAGERVDAGSGAAADAV